MANSLYTAARLAFFRGQIDLENDTISFVLVSGDYTPNVEADEFLDDLGSAVVGTAVDLTGQTVSQSGDDAVLDGEDITFVDVTGDTALYMVGYQNTGDSATSRLIVFIDTSTILPLTPTGVSVPVRWSSAGIFSWAGC